MRYSKLCNAGWDVSPAAGDSVAKAGHLRGSYQPVGLGLVSFLGGYLDELNYSNVPGQIPIL
jgi:hypothetical protein